MVRGSAGTATSSQRPVISLAGILRGLVASSGKASPLPATARVSRRVAAILLFTVGCGGAPAFSLGPPSTVLPVVTFRIPTPVPEQMPSFSGTDDLETASFTLSGGDYVVHWTAQGECFFGVLMKEDSGTGFEDVVSADVSGSRNGTANMHDVPRGEWYFDVITGCRWTLRVAPA